LTCLLITAGPEFTDRAWCFRFLDRLHAERGIAAVLHLPESEAPAREWATARGLPHGPAPDDPAGMDAVAALPGPVPGHVYLNRMELLRPDHLVLRRGPGGGRLGVLCVGNVTYAITGSVRDGGAVAVCVLNAGRPKGGRRSAARPGRALDRCDRAGRR
jgi:hypothetical protein